MRRLGLVLVIGVLVGAASPQRPSLVIDAGQWDVPDEFQPKEQRSTDNGHADTQADQRSTESMPLTVKLLNTGKSDQEAAQEAAAVDEKSKLDRWVGSWSVWLTSALVVATILQFIALLYQGLWLRRSVKVAESALLDLERGYLFVTDFRSDVGYILDSLSMVHEVTIIIGAMNYGRTPCTIIGASMSLSILETEPDVAMGVRLSGSEEGLITWNEFVVGPGNPHQFPRLSTGRVIKHEISSRLNGGTASLYCYGWVRYIDIFKKPHPIVFCRRYSVTGATWEAVGGSAKNYAN